MTQLLSLNQQISLMSWSASCLAVGNCPIGFHEKEGVTLVDDWYMTVVSPKPVAKTTHQQ